MASAIGPPSAPAQGRGRTIVVCCADEDRPHVQPSVEILAGRGVTVELLETAHASAEEITAAVRRSPAGTWAICESAVLDAARVDRVRSILFICGIDEEAVHRVSLDWRNPLELFERLNALVPVAQPTVRVRPAGPSMPVDDDDDATACARSGPRLTALPKLVAVPKPTAMPPTAPRTRSATMIGRPAAATASGPTRAPTSEAPPANMAAVRRPAEPPARAANVAPTHVATPAATIPARPTAPISAPPTATIPAPPAATIPTPPTAPISAPPAATPAAQPTADVAHPLAPAEASSSPRPERLLGAPSPVAVAPAAKPGSTVARNVRSLQTAAARWLGATTRSQRKIAGASVLGVVLVGVILSVAVDWDGDADPGDPSVAAEGGLGGEPTTLATGSNPDPKLVDGELELVPEVRTTEIEAEIAAAATRGDVGRYREIVFAPTEPKRHNFTVSRTTCEQLEVGALDNWRLPTLGELDDLTRSRTMPRDAYWSSTESEAWGTRALVWNGRKVRASPVSKGWRGGFALCVLE